MKYITLFMDDNAWELYMALAKENDTIPQYFLPKLLLREARVEAASLPVDKLKDRLVLIDKVEEELHTLIRAEKPVAWDNTLTSPRAIYSKIWAYRKYMRGKGYTEEQIHMLCLSKYGRDIDAKQMPQKNNNPKGRKVKISEGA